MGETRESCETMGKFERQRFVGEDMELKDRMRNCGRGRTVEVNEEMWEE